MESSNFLDANKNQLYPVFLKLDHLRILLVGAGNVGLEKLTSLLSNSPFANITVVAPLVKEEIRTLLLKHQSCSIIERSFERGDIENKELIFLATDNPSLHEDIKKLAAEKGILVNVADTPGLCDFYLGSIVQKGSLKIAISTNGKSPTIAKRIKEIINELLPDDIDSVLDNMQVIRNRMKGDFKEKIRQLNELTSALVAENELLESNKEI
ncbi:MAG: bifunctional precorrin-2 dehydrogenase/sirohydrochlorin ferrochelatase [Chitinophagaceae bacterium]